MQNDKLFEVIRNGVASDIAPVRPLGPPWKRALNLLLIWLSLVAVVLVAFGLRSDYQVLGPWAVLMLTLAQILAAYLVIVFGMRLAAPGRLVSTASLVLLAFAASAIHLFVSGMTFFLSPTRVEASRAWPYAFECFGSALLLGLLPLALILTLSRRGLPMRPLPLGMLCGLGSGLTGEAAWRMHCPFNSWDHVLVAHSGAILATTLLGGLIGFLWERRRLERFDQRHQSYSMPSDRRRP